jgi:hypothetical protein
MPLEKNLLAKAMNQTEASKTVLVEVMNVLGLYRDHLVLVGGWVPELLLPGRGHIGSLDVDLAVDVRSISQRQYDTILQRLLAAGYSRTSNCFVRSVRGAQEPVKLDLITGEYGDADAREVSARMQEIRIGKLRGTDLAFEASQEISLGGEMPDGGRNTVQLRIVRVEAFVLMKAFAMSERTKAKDAYDIYFCLKHFPDGAAELAGLCRPLSGNGLVREGLQLLHDKFGSMEAVGPKWAAEVAAETGAEPEMARREAYELMRQFLSAAGVPQTTNR